MRLTSGGQYGRSSIRKTTKHIIGDFQDDLQKWGDCSSDYTAEVMNTTEVQSCSDKISEEFDMEQGPPSMDIVNFMLDCLRNITVNFP